MSQPEEDGEEQEDAVAAELAEPGDVGTVARRRG